MRLNEKIIVCVVILAITLFSLCACGDNASEQKDQASKSQSIESDTLVATENPNAYFNEEIIDLLNESWESAGIQGEWTFIETDDDIWCYVFIPNGTENDGISSFVDYYFEYGPDEYFISYWDGGVVLYYQELAGYIEDVTGEVVLIGIANPYNTDNIILIVNRDTVIYDAFYEEGE